MTDTYLGEIRPFSFDFCPKGWAYCDGSLLSINKYAALYSLLGTNYGGDGRETFALPDLRSRTPINAGETDIYDFRLGMADGQEKVTLNAGELPAHSHNMKVDDSSGNKPSIDTFLAIPTKGDTSLSIYNPAVYSPILLNETTIGLAGEGKPHNNMQPFLALNYCIAVEGEYPPRP